MKTWKLALVLSGTLLLAACAAEPKSTTTTTTTLETHTLTGTFTLVGTEDDPLADQDGEFVVAGGTCSGTSGYDDVEAGVQVTVSNEAGTVIGTGYLEPGEQVEAGCEFRFEINDVPVAKFYKVDVGRRGEISYSYQEMKEAMWSVELSLGD